MPLIRRRVTSRMIAANRANARKSTGPRTARGKAQARLNGLRHGSYSRLYLNYLHLWFDALLRDPRKPPLPWEISKMPNPPNLHPVSDRWEARRTREFLLSVRAYPQPAPRARSLRREKGKLNNPFFAPGAVKPLKTQEGFPKRTPRTAKTNWQRTGTEPTPAGPSARWSLSSRPMDVG